MDEDSFPGQLADTTGFMIYGVEPVPEHELAQSGEMMYGYKREVGGNAEHLRLVKALASIGLLKHTACLRALPGNRGLPMHWATVPSRSGRAQHPLREIARNLTRDGAVEAPLTAHGPKVRQVRPGAFTCDVDQTGAHVLLLEDTWARGATAQSAAMAFKAAGAERVSVLTIARWIRPGWSSNGQFLASLPDWQEAVCPWTAGPCPRV